MKSAKEVADTLERIASEIRENGNVSNLQAKELGFILAHIPGLPGASLGVSTKPTKAYQVSPDEAERISKLSATERIKIANRMDQRIAAGWKTEKTPAA